MRNILRYRFLINPLIRQQAENLGRVVCVNKIKRETPVIVSLTENKSDYLELELCIYSILNQTICPDRIILWLSDEYKSLSELPYEITQYIKNGVEIRFIRNLGAYNKFIYPLKEFPNSIVVTASDDIYYKENWLETLYHSYITNPNDIQVHLASKILLNNNEIAPSKDWKLFNDNESSAFTNFINSDGGVLIPPKSLSKEVLRDDIFMKYVPYDEDLWLWLMSVVSSKKIRIVKNHIKTITCTNIYNKIKQNSDNHFLHKFDNRLNKLMHFYGQNVLTKLT